MKRGKNITQLPDQTMIDVVAICGEKKIVKSMTMIEWKSLAKKPGWRYIAYQKGFHSFNTDIHEG